MLSMASTHPSGAEPLAGRGLPQLRFMGSKHRLLPWLSEVLAELEFDSVLDAFAGSGSVAYLLKTLGKAVTANDALELSHQVALAAVENSHHRLRPEHLERLLAPAPDGPDFIARTFEGIFFTAEDLRFLDRVWANLGTLEHPHLRALALASLARACLKRQPRGVFTVAGDPQRYNDGRRDLSLSLEQQFLESAQCFNAAVLDTGRRHHALRSDVFALSPEGHDLVYLDPPYVPRADDNCYIKRYHFVEGLMTYWQGPETEILQESRVKKLKKRFTPFSYRRTALDAFDRLFRHFQASTLVLSYSSNGYPDLPVLVELMGRYKGKVEVHERPHRYSFGTHGKVKPERVVVREYLLVGR